MAEFHRKYRVRKYSMVRLLVAATLVWGFVAPVVHLACGMPLGDVELLCDDGEAMHAAEFSAHDMGVHAHDDAAPGRSVGQSADDMSLACCTVEPAVTDGVTPRMDVHIVPDVAASTFSPEITPEPSTSSPAVHPEDDASPPVALQVLFSVFLI